MTKLASLTTVKKIEKQIHFMNAQTSPNVRKGNGKRRKSDLDKVRKDALKVYIGAHNG